MDGLLNNDYPNEQESFYAAQLGKIYQRYKACKKRENLLLKQELKKDLEIFKEEEAEKRSVGFGKLLRRINLDRVLNNIESNKKSDNLATQVRLRQVDHYVAAAAAAGGGAAAGAGGSAAAGAGSGAVAAGSEGIGAGGGKRGGMSGQMSGFGRNFSGNIGGRMRSMFNRFGEESEAEEGSLEDEVLDNLPSDEEEEKEEEDQEEADVARQRALRQAQMGMEKIEKAKQAERTAQRAAQLAKRVKQIKTLLTTAKIGTILTSLPSLGITLLITILIWIGQFIGHYLLGIEIVPGYDWVDYIMMFIIGFLIMIISLPIIVIFSGFCVVDVFGIIC